MHQRIHVTTSLTSMGTIRKSLLLFDATKVLESDYYLTHVCSYYVHCCSFRNMVSSSWHATTNKNKWNCETLKNARIVSFQHPVLFLQDANPQIPRGICNICTLLNDMQICICFIMIWFTNIYNKTCMVTHSVYMSSSTISYISRYLVLLAQPWARH